MSVNLLEQVQQSLGYPALNKIDPNTDNNHPQNEPHSLEQAAVPAVLTALYKYVQSDEGAGEVLSGTASTDWAGKIFHGKHIDAVEKIENYVSQPIENIRTQLNKIADTAVAIVKNNIGENGGIKELKSLFLNQRNNILPYLPPALNLGHLLNDDTIDDNVNKMEGPVSSLMNGIGSVFSNPVTGDEAKKF